MLGFTLDSTQLTNHFKPMSTPRATYIVQILPSTGNGPAYNEEIQAINPNQAKQLAKARIPADWKVGNSPRRIGAS